MDIYNTFATDEAAEVSGVWKNLSKTARIKVARSGNPKWQAEMRRELEENAAALDAGGDGADKAARELEIRVMARTILLDWEGLSFRGQAVDYSVEMAETMLAVKDFKKRVKDISDSLETFRVREEVALGEGSPSTSSGT